jgi:hypothetical protein
MYILRKKENNIILKIEINYYSKQNSIIGIIKKKEKYTIEIIGS